MLLEEKINLTILAELIREIIERLCLFNLLIYRNQEDSKNSLLMTESFRSFPSFPILSIRHFLVQSVVSWNILANATLEHIIFH